MAVGDRIKRARNLRGMTQKELGIAIGFEEKSADIRIAQYESNTRTPKEELLRKIAEVLDVNYRSLYEPTLYAAEDVMYTLFELDEHYPGTRLYEVIDTTDPDFPEKHMAVSFRYRLLDDFLKEWHKNICPASARKNAARQRLICPFRVILRPTHPSSFSVIFCRASSALSGLSAVRANAP